MAANTGVDREALSLPKGGGAVQSLGTTFDADLNTGTGQYAVPIDVPAGPNGIRPQVSLRYASTTGNGPFGLGWGLGLMAIARQTDGGLPLYDDAADTFVLPGAEELVPDGGARFRPAVDTLHWRIERSGDGWQVLDTKGTMSRLGSTDMSRIERPPEGSVGGARAAVWLLDAMEDASGNRVLYEYLPDGPQRYLQSLRWGTYELRLEYEERPDPISSGRFGFLLSTRLRCARIELHVAGESPSLVRSWALGYEPAQGCGLSLLRRVVHRGHGPDGTAVAAPPLTLTYTEPAAPVLSGRKADPAAGHPPSFRTGRAELVDWNGDGLPDLLELHGGRARVWPNLGRGRWGPPSSLPRLPFPLGLESPDVAFGDMDGNGTADLIWLDRLLSGYYPLRPGGGFDAPRFWRHGPSVRPRDPDAALVDLDGDGVVDLLVTRDRFFELYYRERANGWRGRPHLVPRSQAPPVSLADPRVFLADMNGDGLPDFVRVDGSGVTYWPYLGRGRWADAVSMRPAPRLPSRFDPQRLRLSDVDGDGCADLVYVDFDRVLYWMNEAGTRLGQRQEVSPTPPAALPDVRWADMDGRGTAGILWSPVAPGPQRRQYFLDLAGGRKPHLLAGIDNGVGLQTRIRYATSTELASDDAERDTPWSTFRPFPLHCVVEVENCDRTTGLCRRTRYRYAEARYDPERRTFLGFHRVEVEQEGDASIPTLLTRSLFHVGLDPQAPERPLSREEKLRFGALRRRVLRCEVYGLDGGASQARPYRTTEHEYDVRLEAAGSGGEVAVPLLRRSLERQWERAEEPFAFREVSHLAHDDHGNATMQRTRAWRAGAPQPDQDVVVETTYARNLERNVVALPARTTTRTPQGKLLAAEITLYDGAAHAGLPEGEVAEGNVTARYQQALTDELAAEVFGTAQPDWAQLGYERREGAWWIRTVSYERRFHQQGLTLVSRGPRGFDTVMEYDPSRQQPRALSDALGNRVEATVAPRVFQVATVVDANGHASTDHFDALGRVVAMTTPGTQTMPSTEIEYLTGQVPVGAATRKRERHGQAETLDEVEYYDGQGRLLQRVVEGEGEEGRRFVVAEALSYNSRGQVGARCTPFFRDEGGYRAPPAESPRQILRYDAAGRLVERIRPDGARRRQHFQPGRIVVYDEGENAKEPESARRPAIFLLDARELILELQRWTGERVATCRYRYDEGGRMVASEDAQGAVSRLTYDLLGRVVAEHSPATGTTLFVIDAAGNSVGRRLQSGRATRSRYDALDRLVATREEGEPRDEVECTYVDAGSAAPADGVRNRRARLWRVRDRLGTLTFAYDAVGRVVQRRRLLDTQPDHELVTDVEYDALGRPLRTVLPAAAGGLRRIVDTRYSRRGLAESSPGLVRRAEYDASGNLTRLVYQNGVETLLDHDPLSGRPGRLQVRGPGGEPLRDQRYSFDPLGNLLRVASPLAAEAMVADYDALSRLATARYDSGETFSYSYDDAGHVTRAPVGELAYGGAPGSGQVAAAGGGPYAWDADGHLVEAPYGRLGFDAFDNLRSALLPDGRRIEYECDYRGLRARRRVVDGGESVFPDDSLEIHDGALLFWADFGGRRVQAFDPIGRALFLHADLGGTPTLFTDLQGREVARLGTGPYGTLRFRTGDAGLPEPLRFTGQGADADTGLIVLGRRYYDPRLASFVSPDRVAGVYALDAWSRYVYAHDNPFRFVDPSGNDATDVLAFIGVGLLALTAVALVVAGAFTAGATWAGAGLLTVALWGAATGILTGAATGAMSGFEGGNILYGMLFGMAVGGVTGFIGGFVGSAVGGALAAVAASAAPYLNYIVQGLIVGATMGIGTGATLNYAGGKGSSRTLLENIWKSALIGGAVGALMGFGAAYVQENPYLNISLEKFQAIEGSVWNQLNMQQSTAGTITKTIVGSIASASQGAQAGMLGVGGMFVSVGAAPAGLSIPIGWAAPLIMGMGIYQAPALFLALDRYDVLTLGTALRLGHGLAPYAWIVELLLQDTSGWKEMFASLDTFYPKRA